MIDNDLDFNRRLLYSIVVDILIKNNFNRKGKTFIKDLKNYYFFNSYQNNHINIDINKQFDGTSFLSHILEFKNRLLPIQKYEVSLSSKIKTQLEHNKSLQIFIKNFQYQLKNGASIKQYYPESLFNDFKRKNKNTTHTLFSDNLLNGLSIRHAHMANSNADEIVFYAKIDNKVFIIIHKENHSIFGDGIGILEIINLIANEFPEFIEKYRLNNVIENIFLTDKQIFNAINNINISICITTITNETIAPDVGNMQQIMSKPIHLSEKINLIADAIFNVIKTVPDYYFIDNSQLYCKFSDKSITKIDIDIDIDNLFNDFIFQY